MVLGFIPALIGVTITVALAAAAVTSGSFTAWAGVVAAVFASLIVVLVGWPFFALLVLFVIASVLATRYGFEEKRRKNVHEGTHGERGITNVLAHVLIPAGLAIVATLAPSILPPAALAVLFTAALAFGSADTFASEFGVLSGAARSILTGRKVPAGTNGGVSAIGELWAVVGALTTGIVGYIFLVMAGAPVPSTAVLVGGASIAGFVGCQVDSVLGETLENRGWLTKGSTNVLGMLSSVSIGAAIVALAGGFV
ncbi:MAG TPA: DUF92 domain-containing protein [Thermoplasmata archaeon]|nr:DUF92 domain-containing protein [Thermoplasmata archaeon]